VPASERDGAGMRRHVHSGNHAAESFVSFIPLFDGSVLLLRTGHELVIGPSGIDSLFRVEQ
jgi:hypothetical protein